jgi:hypothetical protein
MRAEPALTQGALFSMPNVACRILEQTNVRFNEIYLAFRVEENSSAAKTGAVKASEFANVYSGVLKDNEIRSCRVAVESRADIEELKLAKKIREVASRGGFVYS